MLNLFPVFPYSPQTETILFLLFLRNDKLSGSVKRWLSYRRKSEEVFIFAAMKKIVFITGATSGFGEACAYKFAQNNYDLILNGRRVERLETLKKNLEEQYKVSCCILPFDVQNRQAVFDSINALPEQ